MDKDAYLRTHLIELLNGNSSHVDLESALKEFPVDQINEMPGGTPYSPWQLLEHLKLAQSDIIDFSRNPDYKEMKWPDDYWPTDEGTPEKWKNSVHQVLSDLQEMRDLVASENTDLYAMIPHGSGQTILREAMLVADHNAYHLGQIVLLKKILEQ
jgi:hypothetical protein